MARSSCLSTEALREEGSFGEGWIEGRGLGNEKLIPEDGYEDGKSYRDLVKTKFKE